MTHPGSLSIVSLKPAFGYAFLVLGLLPMQYAMAIRAKCDALGTYFFHRLGIRTVFDQLVNGSLLISDHVMEINGRRMRKPAHKTILRRFELGPQGSVIAFILSRTRLVLFPIFLIPTFVGLSILFGANDWIFIWHLSFDSNF